MSATSPRELPTGAGQARCHGTVRPVVLIVEDNEDTRVMYQEFLELLGFRVASVGSGVEAVEALRLGDIDAVLLDLTLPDTDGRVLHEQLRELALPRQLPVMALTGHDLSEGERGKFTAVMLKPVDLDAVATWLRQVAPRSESSGEAT